MPDVMMQLGGYRFSVSTAAYARLSRSNAYRWAEQQRIGAHDALQFTGYGSETLDLQGAIYPFYRGGLGQVDGMRADARAARALFLISGLGRILGRFVILQVDEEQSAFAEGGAPRRIDFSLRLRAYRQGGLGGLLSF